MQIDLTYSIADQSFRRGRSLGILNVSLNLLRHLSARPEIGRITVLGNSTFDRDMLPGGVRVSWRDHDEVLKSDLHRLIWDQWRVFGAARASGNRWLFLPKGFASFVREPGNLLACVLCDGMHDYYSEHYPRGFPRLETAYFLASFKAAIRRADVIFTISGFTTSEVLRIAKKYGLTPPPVITMGIGFSDNDFLPSKLRARGSRENNIIVLASRWPHKRTELALSFMRAWQERTRYKGTVSWVGALPDGMVLPPLPNWSLLPRLSFEEYGRLLGGARSLVYFSDYEGFGMPPIEALLAGAAPVYSDIPAAREVMAGAGFPFSNADAESFAAALDRALEASPGGLAAWRDEALKRHSWSAVCSRVVAGLAAAESAMRS